jgi:hypothetical protein
MFVVGGSESAGGGCGNDKKKVGLATCTALTIGYSTTTVKFKLAVAMTHFKD